MKRKEIASYLLHKKHGLFNGCAFEIKYSQFIDFDKIHVHWLTDNPAWTTDFDIVASQDIVVAETDGGIIPNLQK